MPVPTSEGLGLGAVGWMGLVLSGFTKSTARLVHGSAALVASLRGHQRHFATLPTIYGRGGGLLTAAEVRSLHGGLVGPTAGTRKAAQRARLGAGRPIDVHTKPIGGSAST